MSTKTNDWKMDSMPTAFCHVSAERSDDSFTSVKLISYETCVCWIERLTSVSPDSKGAAFLYCTGNYSRSTIKHIGRFTQEFCGEDKYYILRDLLKEALRKDYNVAAVEYELSVNEVKAFDKKLAWYESNGKKFHKYSHEPNYWSYDSKFNALNL